MEVPYTAIILFFFLTFFLLHANLFVEGFNEEHEEEIQRSHFPNGFLFGTATSAYQIEGAYLEGGKSLSNWDVFCHIKGSIKNGENGNVADDHYHRYMKDLEIMHSLGLNAYRLSISWTRILPRGIYGEVNPDGIKFYNKIIDTLLQKGIEPFVTIHHYDYPQELEDRYGGWLSPLMQEEFAHFAKFCFKSFGDRVKYWITINEPNLFAEMAYMRGWYPPARCSLPFGNCSAGNSDMEPLLVMHNMLLAHAKTVKLYREQFQPGQGGFVGIVAHMFMFKPLTDDEHGREAASRALAFNVAWTLDPLVYGDYPPEMRRHLGSQLPSFSLQEKDYIKGSIDFIGVNHYSAIYAKDCIYSSCNEGGDRPVQGFIEITGERDGVLIGEQTGMDKFYVVPKGMEEIIDYLKNRYNNKPMFVTENGYSTLEKQGVPIEELLHDVKRIGFHKAYLASLAQAIRNGADVRGYFIWSLMDDFEWTFGYGTRFGLHYIHRQTLNRVPKLSAKWYKKFLTNSSFNKEEGKNNTSVFGNNDVIMSGSKDAMSDI